MTSEPIGAPEVAVSPDCIFCKIVSGEAPATILAEYGEGIVIEPLGPVVPGHVLVIPREHVADATVDPLVTSLTMRAAARWATSPCNIITSAGPAATQSVYHLHVHVVPRRRNDGLMLPWGSNEAHMRQYDDNAYLFYSGVGGRAGLSNVKGER